MFLFIFPSLRLMVLLPGLVAVGQVLAEDLRVDLPERGHRGGQHVARQRQGGEREPGIEGKGEAGINICKSVQNVALGSIINLCTVSRTKVICTYTRESISLVQIVKEYEINFP